MFFTVKTKLTRIFLLSFLFLHITGVSAQTVVKQSLDSLKIMIGQQTNLTVSVETDENQKIVFPDYKKNQKLVKGIEIVRIAKSDTFKIPNNRLRIEKKYTLTSFDEKVYVIPGLSIKVNNQVVRANNLPLKVITVNVDTTQTEKFYPPKPVQNNPFLWSEWIPLFVLSWVILIIMAALFYVYQRLKKNKPILRYISLKKYKTPHQKALDSISILKEQRQSYLGRQKEYYTQLTDILRTYIQERFHFNAMEMTSSEIIEQIQKTNDNSMIKELVGLFQTSDLVKFAQFIAAENDNINNLVTAVQFINDTKIEKGKTKEILNDTLLKPEVENKSVRRKIMAILTVLLIAEIMLALYVIYRFTLLIE